MKFGFRGDFLLSFLCFFCLLFSRFQVFVVNHWIAKWIFMGGIQVEMREFNEKQSGLDAIFSSAAPFAINLIEFREPVIIHLNTNFGNYSECGWPM